MKMFRLVILLSIFTTNILQPMNSSRSEESLIGLQESFEQLNLGDENIDLLTLYEELNDKETLDELQTTIAEIFEIDEKEVKSFLYRAFRQANAKNEIEFFPGLTKHHFEGYLSEGDAWRLVGHLREHKEDISSEKYEIIKKAIITLRHGYSSNPFKRIWTKHKYNMKFETYLTATMICYIIFVAAFVFVFNWDNSTCNYPSYNETCNSLTCDDFFERVRLENIVYNQSNYGICTGRFPQCELPPSNILFTCNVIKLLNAFFNFFVK